MKKVTLLLSKKDRNSALRKLQQLGVLHVKNINPPQSDDIQAVQSQLAQLDKVLKVLGVEQRDVSGIPFDQAADDIKKILDIFDERNSLQNELSELNEIKQWFETWSDVSIDNVKQLREAGVTIRLYITDRAGVKKLSPDHMVQIIRENQGTVYLALFAESDEEQLNFKEVLFPSIEPKALRSRIRQIDHEISRIGKTLKGFLKKADSFMAYKHDLKKSQEFNRVSAGMGIEEHFVYLQGFCPVDTVKDFIQVAGREGWGYVLEDPDDPAEVPTLLRNSKVPRIIEPLFKFMGTLPGYHEVDVSLVFLVFFSLFYAMIIGDAGYGFVFLAATAFFRYKNRRAPFEPFALFYVLSITTIIWGSLTGTWFGSRIIAEWPPLQRFIIEPMFSFNESKEATLFMMRFSFMLGLIHLIVAHFIAFIKKLPALKAATELGWILICTGMFFVVDLLVLSKPLPGFALVIFIAGLVVIGLFTNFQKNPIKMLGGFLGAIANSIQDVIAAFSDIVSYIRLFAVGLAGVTVAASFNDMANGVFAPIVLILGHGLNIVLGMMSVMVHGVRLNMLEFSGHMGQEWTGNGYEPFKESESID